MERDCDICRNHLWILLEPQNWVAPCFACSGDLSLPDIELTRGIKLVKKDGKWSEVKVRFDCSICGDSGQVYRAYVEPDVSANKATEKVPCPKCTKAPREVRVSNG